MLSLVHPEHFCRGEVVFAFWFASRCRWSRWRLVASELEWQTDHGEKCTLKQLLTSVGQRQESVNTSLYNIVGLSIYNVG